MSEAENKNLYSIPGGKILLIGASGAGKTHAITTFVEAGITPFILFTEQGMSTIGKALKEKGLPEDSCKWHYISPGASDLKSMITMGKNINRMSFEAITKMSDPNKGNYLQWVDLLESCNNFIDDRSGKEYGNIGSWGTDRVLCFDSLTGINNMAMNLVVGSRPTRGQQDWQVAQNNLYNFLLWLTNELRCHLLITGHLERETDEISGGIQLMVSTLGKKLAPKLPPMFDEVILAKRLADSRVWSTVEGNVDLKSRLLPEGSNIKPTFKTFIDAWKKAGGKISE